MLLIALRYGLTAVLLIPWLRWPRGHFRQIVAVSFTLGFLHFSLMITGLVGVDSSVAAIAVQAQVPFARSEEHTSELQSLMRISYAVFCLKKKNINHMTNTD